MRLKPPTVKKPHDRVVFEEILKELALVTVRVTTLLQTNKIASEDEREAVEKALETATTVLREVLGRTAQLREDVSLWRTEDVKLGVKFDGLGNDVEYLVELATVMLGKLRNKGHITAHEYDSFYRFWLMVVKQHELLYGRWRKATA